MIVLSFIFGSCAALWFLNLAYAVSTVLTARLFGMIVEEVCVGMSRTLWTWQHNGQVWRFKLLPISSYTQFRTTEDKEGELDESKPLPGSFEAAPIAGRLLTMAVGPVTSLLVGVVLLGVAVFLGHPQLMAEVPPASEWPPEIVHASGQSTWQGQFSFAADTAGQYFVRLITFRSLEGWGGYVAFCVSSGRVGGESVIDWLTLMGLAGLTQGCVSLLPIPPSNGFQMLQLIMAASLGRSRLPTWVTLPLVYLGLFLVAVLAVRVLWLDACWILRR